MPAGASERFVLDSYALLAYFQDEEGADKVQTVLEMGSEGKAHLFLSVVNLGEVLYVVERERGVSRAHEILARIEEMPIEIVDVDRKMALEAAHLKARYPIAYADCFALALARIQGASLVTGDPEFRTIKPEDSQPVLWLREDA